MLSWQRISALARRANGPLFFLDDPTAEEPVVVLSMQAYESLLQGNRVVQGDDQEPIRVPIRFESAHRTDVGVSREGGSQLLAPDLLLNDSTPIRSQMSVSSQPSVAMEEESPTIMTPPSSLTDERSLEERFYFQSPISEEYR